MDEEEECCEELRVNEEKLKGRGKENISQGKVTQFWLAMRISNAHQCASANIGAWPTLDSIPIYFKRRKLTG